MSTTPKDVQDQRWQTEMQDFIVGRYGRVQAAAQTWLTIMTTLFGLFSAVAVIGGPKTIKEINGGLPWQIGVVVGAVAVFALAFVAVMYGLFASWGGLGGVVKDEAKDPKEPGLTWRGLRQMWSPRGLTLPEIAHPDWRYFREYTVERGNLNRKRLHRSRVLGVTAVLAVALLGLALIVNGFIA